MLAISMEIFLKFPVVGEVVIKLLVDNLLQNLAERRKNCNWSVILLVKLAFLLVEWDHFAFQPVGNFACMTDKVII